MIEKKLTEKMRENPFIMATFMLGLVCLVLILYNFYYAHYEMQGWKEDVCNDLVKYRIGTPAWFDNEGNYLASGYTDFNGVSIDIVNEDLIPQRVHFIYSSNCGWCHKQIEYFGSTWEDYVNSDLTIDCALK